MSIKIILQGREVKNPLARFFFGLLEVVLLTLFGAVSVVLILPLIGVTLVLSIGMVAFIVFVCLVLALVCLASYQHRNKKLKHEKTCK